MAGKSYKSLLCLLIILATASCRNSEGLNANVPQAASFTCDSTPVAKQGRELGMDILDATPGHTYATNLARLKALKGSYQTLHLTWSALEGAGSGSTSGAYTDPSNALQTFNSIALSDGIKLSLTIRPIDMTGKTVPSDLSSTRFNSADLKSRFKALIDFVLTRIQKENLVAIMIGNEIDGYDPGADVNFWSDYGDFLNDVRTYASSTYAGLKVGFTATHSGVTDSSKTLALGWNSVAVMQTYASLADVVGVTYYPIDSSFRMKPTSAVAADFASLDAFTTIPIYIQEIGYSSSASTAGSEELQARFVCEALKAWDTHRAGIPRMAFLRLNDISRAQAETMALPYGVSNEAFIEYLRTLGLYSHSGTAKSSFSVLSTELQRRGF